MIEAINHAISYRLKNRTRLSEIETLKQAKRRLEKILKSLEERVRY